METKPQDCRYAEYDFGNIADIVRDAKDILLDAERSYGLTRVSEKVLLRQALERIEFVDKVMRDSRETLKQIKYRTYSGPNEVADEGVGPGCCKDEA